MKSSVLNFIYLNRKTLFSIIIGLISGYLFWRFFGIQWGTYPLSSECWVNCTYGALFGGLISCLLERG